MFKVLKIKNRKNILKLVESDRNIQESKDTKRFVKITVYFSSETMIEDNRVTFLSFQKETKTYKICPLRIL